MFGRFSSSSGKAKPVNGTIYHAEPYFGLGDKIQSTEWYCLYNGRADSVAIYGIEQGYSYDIQVVEYIEVSGLPVYFTTTGNANPGIFSSSLFSEQTNIIPASVFREVRVAWGDYDNDGYLDFLLTGYWFVTRLYHNNGITVSPNRQKPD